MNWFPKIDMSYDMSHLFWTATDLWLVQKLMTNIIVWLIWLIPEDRAGYRVESLGINDGVDWFKTNKLIVWV